MRPHFYTVEGRLCTTGMLKVNHASLGSEGEGGPNLALRASSLIQDCTFTVEKGGGCTMSDKSMARVAKKIFR